MSSAQGTTLKGVGGGRRGGKRRGDQIFSLLTGTAALTVLIVIFAIAIFLVSRAVPALRENSSNFLTEKQFLTDQKPPVFGIAALAFGTLLTSLLALVIAVPVALGVALYVTEYAPPRVARPLGYLVDLLAAVPSVVFGLWGLNFLLGHSEGLQVWLQDHLSWIPLFKNDIGSVGRSILLASIVLSIMILPIVAAISREVFTQVPQANREAALALGATKLEMIRTAVIPFSRAGVISAIMLGLGRALGETIAIALVLSASFDVSIQVLRATGGNTIAANIATKFGEADPSGRGALIATGLVLFIITLAVNMVARGIIYRSNRLETKGAA
ncbi:MAG: phosphate transport system permease protein [Frankiaceae bacterium]|nr:phosphate transport system permease protein [Frankiaceae bacterium]